MIGGSIGILLAIHLWRRPVRVACFDHLVQFVLVIEAIVWFIAGINLEVALMIIRNTFNRRLNSS